MSLNDFIFGKILGKGSFGTVNIVTRKEDNKIYAMKRVNIIGLSDKDKRSSLNEIRILASLSHRNIIDYKEAFFDERSKTLNIVMEFAEEGDIAKKVKENLKHRSRFKEDNIWEWLIQILEGLKYLKNLYHLNIWVSYQLYIILNLNKFNFFYYRILYIYHQTYSYHILKYIRLVL